MELPVRTPAGQNANDNLKVTQPKRSPRCKNGARHPILVGRSVLFLVLAQRPQSLRHRPKAYGFASPGAAGSGKLLRLPGPLGLDRILFDIRSDSACPAPAADVAHAFLRAASPFVATCLMGAPDPRWLLLPNPNVSCRSSPKPNWDNPATCRTLSTVASFRPAWVTIFCEPHEFSPSLASFS